MAQKCDMSDAVRRRRPRGRWARHGGETQREGDKGVAWSRALSETARAGRGEPRNEWLAWNGRIAQPRQVAAARRGRRAATATAPCIRNPASRRDRHWRCPGGCVQEHFFDTGLQLITSREQAHWPGFNIASASLQVQLILSGRIQGRLSAAGGECDSRCMRMGSGSSRMRRAWQFRLSTGWPFSFLSFVVCLLAICQDSECRASAAGLRWRHARQKDARKPAKASG